MPIDREEPDEFDRYHTDDFDRPRRVRQPRGQHPWLLALGCLGLLGFGCCGGVAALAWYFLSPHSYPEQTQDYAAARKQFHTQLTVHEPAPQPFLDQVPPGAKVIPYSSGPLELKAWLGGPPGRGLHPAVLFLHGGYALDLDDWTQTQPFRDAGFITLLPMLRGENGLPGDFSLFYNEVDDALAAAAVLARQDGVDPKRIYIAGHSAGGTIAMLSAMTSPMFRACAAISGEPDPMALTTVNPGLVPFNVEDREELIMRAPLAFPKSFKCPTRLYYGDEEVFLMFSTPRLAEKASAAGLDVEAVKVKGDHFNSARSAIPQAIAFFQRQ